MATVEQQFMEDIIKHNHDYFYITRNDGKSFAGVVNIEEGMCPRIFFNDNPKLGWGVTNEITGWKYGWNINDNCDLACIDIASYRFSKTPIDDSDTSDSPKESVSQKQIKSGDMVRRNSNRLMYGASGFTEGKLYEVRTSRTSGKINLLNDDGIAQICNAGAFDFTGYASTESKTRGFDIGDMVMYIGDDDRMDITAGGVYKITEIDSDGDILFIDDAGDENFAEQSDLEHYEGKVPEAPSVSDEFVVEAKEPEPIRNCIPVNPYGVSSHSVMESISKERDILRGMYPSPTEEEPESSGFTPRKRNRIKF